MTSSIKDPTVTDAMIEAGVAVLDKTVANRALPYDAGTVRRIYTAMRSMEAKPDPEGLREAVERAILDRLRDDDGKPYTQGFNNGVRAANVVAGQALAALTAKPSLEPTRTELVEALTDLQQAEATYRYAHDVLGTGDPKTGRAWDLMKRAGDEARSVLSRKQSGGGNG